MGDRIMTEIMSDEDDFGQYSGTSNPTVRIETGRYDDLLKKTVPLMNENPKTRIYRGPGETDTTKDVANEDPMKDPVVGWLVVIFGPGRGASLNLGYGRNSIGRGDEERVSLHFGDEQISRIGHAILTYDPRSRKYFLQAGQGPNLTYIEG